MTVVARKVNSVPTRLASETWTRIVDLVAPTNASARAELLSVIGVASSLITRESLKDAPFVMWGEGPRVRVYCIYGEEAIEGVSANETALPDSPAESSAWSASLPCPADDLSWVQAQLARLSSRITARDASETETVGTDSSGEAAASVPKISKEAFLKP
jgi:hypothetical protein